MRNNVTSLAERRRAKALAHMRTAREAQEAIDLGTQYREAFEAAQQIEPLNDADVPQLYLRCAELEVDALATLDWIPYAQLCADQAVRHLDRIAKGSLEAIAARRMQLSMRELGGDAEDALMDFLKAAAGLNDREERWFKRERLLHLQHVLSCARRIMPRRDVSSTVKYALDAGLPLAEELEQCFEREVACFRHVAGCAEMRIVGSGGDREHAATLLDLAHAGRPDTTRDRATRGMNRAERLLAGGDRDGAIELFSNTVEGFTGRLPRHQRSSLEMLASRGLAVA